MHRLLEDKEKRRGPSAIAQEYIVIWYVSYCSFEQKIVSKCIRESKTLKKLRILKIYLKINWRSTFNKEKSIWLNYGWTSKPFGNKEHSSHICHNFDHMINVFIILYIKIKWQFLSKCLSCLIKKVFFQIIFERTKKLDEISSAERILRHFY